ncbi:hypothetical protein R1sor_017027 [Riccia sorocarpa]|uniref:Nucleolus and neural progenitor protein-like N-terminal domain-containing protein n=1 Tax=Riccia sorocarpa TaxID=122646 RepID=A0ABD3I9D4_9MARC
MILVDLPPIVDEGTEVAPSAVLCKLPEHVTVVEAAEEFEAIEAVTVKLSRSSRIDDKEGPTVETQSQSHGAHHCTGRAPDSLSFELGIKYQPFSWWKIMDDKKLESDSEIPLRPPACLAELVHVKNGEEREAVLDLLREEAKQVQKRLKEQLKQFRTEVDIFLRLMYKNKNQHRHALYYRRLQQVRRDLRLLDYSALDQDVEGFTRWTFPYKPSRVNVDQRKLEADQVRSTLCLFLSAVRIFNQIDQPILAASTQILGLLTQGFFMSLAVTLFSGLARLRALSQQLLYEFATAYNLLSVFSKEVPGSAIPGARVNGTSGDSSRLPLHLECISDGGRLVVKEIQSS